MRRFSPTKEAAINPPARQFKNRILAALPKAEIERLKTHLSPVTLVQEETLLDGEAPHGYFLEDGIASVVITVANGDTVEVGIIGIDGVVGIPTLLRHWYGPGPTSCRSQVRVSASTQTF